MRITGIGCKQARGNSCIQKDETGKLQVLYAGRATLAYCEHHSLEDLLNIKLCLSETFHNSQLNY